MEQKCACFCVSFAGWHLTHADIRVHYLPACYQELTNQKRKCVDFVTTVRYQEMHGPLLFYSYSGVNRVLRC